MRRIDVIFEGKEFTFRSNDSGEYLFIGNDENVQISHESGFDSVSRMKKAIREYLRCRQHGIYTFSRIKYSPDCYSRWKP